MNKITVTGNITKDSELTYIGDKGTPKLSFTIANNEGYGDYKKTTFINCVLWGKGGEGLQQHLTKGKKLLVNGKLEINSSEKDGKKTYFTNINVDMFGGIEFIGGKADNGSNSNSEEWGEPVDDGDLPF